MEFGGGSYSALGICFTDRRHETNFKFSNDFSTMCVGRNKNWRNTYPWGEIQNSSCKKKVDVFRKIFFLNRCMNVINVCLIFLGSN